MLVIAMPRRAHEGKKEHPTVKCQCLPEQHNNEYSNRISVAA